MRSHGYPGWVEGSVSQGPDKNPLRLLRWYAAHGERAPANTPLDRFCHGFAQIAVALRHLGRDKALRKAAILPTVLSLGGAALIAALVAWVDFGDDGTTWQDVGRHFAATFIALGSLPPTLLHPLWVRVARSARTSLGLPPGHEEPPHSYLRVVIAEAKKGLRQALIAGVLGLLPLIVLLSLMPMSGWLRGVMLAAWAIYWITVDAFEIPFELSNAPPPRHSPWFARWAFSYGNANQWWSIKLMRKFGRLMHKHSRPWRREIAFTERNAEGVLGFSLALGTLLAIPVLGLVFRSVAIVAATQLASHDPEFHQGEQKPGASSPAHKGAALHASSP